MSSDEIKLPDDTLRLMTDWFRRVRESQQIHYACANLFSRLHLSLGIPTIALSAAAGTAVLASLQKTVGLAGIVVGLISILAAVLASLQTFLGLSDRAETHRVIGARYSAVRRQLESMKTFPPAMAEAKSQLNEIRAKMDELAEEAPEVPAHIKRRVDSRLKREGFDGVFKLPPQGPASRS
jgi:hypothetical protein